MSKTQESSPQGPTNRKWISTGASHVRPPRFDCYFFFYDEVTIREPEDGFLRKSSSLRAPTTTTTSHNCVEPPIEPITMKRKLEQNGVPSGEADTQKRSKTQASAEEDLTFADLGLDARLVQAVAEQNFLKPTLVQRQAIPLALNGKDVLCKSKTGSGKTAAYVLPLLNGILKKKSVDTTAVTSALILVPTRELANQVFKVIEQFSFFCAKDIRAVKLTDKSSDAVQRSLLSTSPDIVISTPARAWYNVKSNQSALSLEKLSHLVLDEADLLLSYGYNEDLENLSWSIPKAIQTIMMSATLTSEIEALKKIFYRDNAPMLLDLEEPDAEGEGVTQLVTKCGEDEKFLLAYIIFKLQLVKGKCIIFVGDVDRCYRLKLFFEQFGIRSCILNSELPVNSRIHVVEEFNRNVYDIIIASDEKEILGNEEKADEEKEEEDDAAQEDNADSKPEQDSLDAEKAAERTKKRKEQKKRASKRDKEYGVSRGIDFKNVAAVINFDLPTSAASYTHRIGRTARAGKAGMALSFVVPKDLFRKHMPTSIASAENDEKVLARITRQQAKLGKEIKPYNFNTKQVEAFRYRMNDALRAVTKVAVREARTRELRQELLKSEKLKRYFEENPTEVNHLRHDGELRTARQQSHLKHVPEYLLPKDGKQGLTAAEIGFVPLHKRGKGRAQRKGKSKVMKRGSKGDPLKTFKARRKMK
ncbi:ATP-dependent DNA/RNA helicase [Claviceps purpurea]|nr:ATP-dependent DNA/RNA helicase [Claviceps purpurea]